MSRVGSAIHYRRLRSPNGHGQRLIDPPLNDAASLLSANAAAAQKCTHDLGGRSLASLSADARSLVRDAAIAYTRNYRSVSKTLDAVPAPVIMTGHQPDLYHPGVWFKNFVLDRVAQTQQAVAINLLVDNDTIGRASLRVPTGTADKPVVEQVAFDQMQAETPFEERRLIDPGLFCSFPQRVRAKLFRSIESPLVEKLWPAAVAASHSSPNVGTCLSQARHQLEATWGLKTLEIPLSQVCETEPFRWFIATLLARLPSFQRIHNELLLEYRRVNRVRSQAHPVPSLATDDEWLEAPFWLWSTADPNRRRLFARQVPHGIEITDRHSVRHHLSISPDGSYEVAVEQLRRLSDQGIKLRSRALLTTMFTRLFLCDLFIHGIGGAKYDQLTDAIIQRFFGLTAPRFLTVTATAKLPIEHRVITEAEIRATNLKLRELRFNPQRHLASAQEATALVREKQRLITPSTQSEPRSERHLQIAQLNDKMQPLVEQQRAQLLRERADLMEHAQIAKLLGSREYSFCLFPETTLRPLLLDI